jgi:nitrate/nitrite transporter NarK
MVEFSFLVGSYGVGIWLPQIIKTGHMSDQKVGLIYSGCYVIASVGMIIWSALVDRSGRRICNLALSCLLGAVGFVGAILSSSFWVSLAWVTVALIGITAARSIFWTVPSQFLTGMAAAGGLAFINSIGTIGGFVGPSMMGWLKERTGSFTAGLMAMAGFLVLATLGAWSLKFSRSTRTPA